MPPDSLQKVQDCFDQLLKGCSGRIHADTIESFRLLYCKLEMGDIAQQVQIQLLKIIETISRNDYAEARKICTTIAAQHWEQHKDWIVGLKRLLANRKPHCPPSGSSYPARAA